MCSIGEDDFGDEGGLHAMPVEPEPVAATTNDPSPALCAACAQTGTVAVVQLPCKGAQCLPCFLAYVRHKFRANIGANKMIPRGGRVLVCYDGSPNSSALLDMIRFGTTMDRFKKLHIEPCVLYVDEQCLVAGPAADNRVDQRRQHLDTIREQLQQFGIEAFYVSVAQSMAASTCEPIAIESVPVIDEKTIDCEADFVVTLDAFGSLTARQEFLHYARTNLIRECAERLGCAFVFVSDTCPDLAVKLLANLALGRGSSVADDLSFCDNRSQTVKILRPIRDFSRLEINEYVRLAELKCGANVQAYGTTTADEFASIQNLTRAFVDELQTGYHSTVSTVFRTGSKIAAASAAGATSKTGRNAPQQPIAMRQETGKCAVCASLLDCEQSDAMLAVNFSRQCALQGDASVDAAAMDTTAKANSSGHDSRYALCYGCKNVFRDLIDDANFDKTVNMLIL